MTEPLTPQDLKRYRRITNLLQALMKPFARITVVGLRNIPQAGPVIICPNHISNIDPVATGTKLAARRPIRALVKQSLYQAPVVSTLMKSMRHVPVDRSSAAAAQVLPTLEILLNAGEAVAIYPEGTIPKAGDGELGKLKTGAQRLSLITRTPIVPVGQWGIQAVMPPGAFSLKTLLKALLKRPRHTIVVGEMIVPTITDTVESITEKLKQELISLTASAKMLTEAPPHSRKRKNDRTATP